MSADPEQKQAIISGTGMPIPGARLPITGPGISRRDFADTRSAYAIRLFAWHHRRTREPRENDSALFRANARDTSGSCATIDRGRAFLRRCGRPPGDEGVGGTGTGAVIVAAPGAASARRKVSRNGFHVRGIDVVPGRG
jgi:hypothetical protein